MLFIPLDFFLMAFLSFLPRCTLLVRIQLERSPQSSSTSSRNRLRSYSRTRSIASDEEDEEPHGNEHDEDVTARFDTLSRRRSAKITSPPTAKTEDHSSALQRVKSLTERNRMVSCSSFQQSGDATHGLHSPAYSYAVFSCATIICATGDSYVPPTPPR